MAARYTCKGGKAVPLVEWDELTEKQQMEVMTNYPDLFEATGECIDYWEALYFVFDQQVYVLDFFLDISEDAPELTNFDYYLPIGEYEDLAVMSYTKNGCDHVKPVIVRYTTI